METVESLTAEIAALTERRENLLAARSAAAKARIEAGTKYPTTVAGSELVHAAAFVASAYFPVAKSAACDSAPQLMVKNSRVPVEVRVAITCPDCLQLDPAGRI